MGDSHPSHKKSIEENKFLFGFFFLFPEGKCVAPDNGTKGCKENQNSFPIYNEILPPHKYTLKVACWHGGFLALLSAIVGKAGKASWDPNKVHLKDTLFENLARFNKYSTRDVYEELTGIDVERV